MNKFLIYTCLYRNAQAISTHSRLTTSPCNRRNACALCADALFAGWLVFSEVVIGNVRAYYVFCSEERMQNYTKTPITMPQTVKIT